MKLHRLPAPGLLLLVALFHGCDSRPDHPRILVLALDGMEPRAVDLLMPKGKLPNLAKLRQEGAYAPLTSANPLLSPVVWTTIADSRAEPARALPSAARHPNPPDRAGDTLHELDERRADESGEQAHERAVSLSSKWNERDASL